jgi:hypothetical protein
MKKTSVAQNVKDVKIDKSDFILQHKNTKFTEVYVVNGLLGEGKEINDTHMNRWLWKSYEMRSQVKWGSKSGKDHGKRQNFCSRIGEA